LDRLTINPEATVIFAEGEKSADAAQRLFPDCVAMTTMNGAQSPAKSDFSPLSGRRVFIAPDYDESGEKYTESVIRLVIAAGGTVERILDNEALAQAGEKLPKGFDLADAAELGWTADRLQSLGEALWVEVLYPSAHSVSVQAVPALPASRASGRGQESFIEGVHEIVSSLFNDQIIYVSGRPYLYREGYWPAVDEVVFVQKPLAQSLAGFGKKDTPTSVNAHMQMIRTLYAEDETRWATNSLLCLANGALDPATGTLYPHSPEHHLVNKVDIAYDPEATCPLWLQTLDEIFRPDEDNEDKIRLLQEFIGYCLVPETRMCQFLWMVGGGGNGKSLILSILTELIGRENVGNSQIERLDRAFVRAELQGKLVNISSEMSAQATVSDGYLKQIVSGDLIEAERKHEKPFSFKPYARLIAATNNLPRLLDHSDGFFRRAIILRFNRQFTEQDRDINREDRLRAELPGILNWALAGLRALNARGRFVIPPSSEQEILRYRTDSDPIRQYAEEKLELDHDSRVQSRELYEDYVQWSRGNGYQPLATNSFASRLESLGFQRGRNAQGRYWQAQFVWRMAERSESSISSLAAQYMV
jgi:putative DNA primase/helicase